MHNPRGGRLWLGIVVLAVGCVAGLGGRASAQTAEETRVETASTVFGEIMTAPDSGIPKSVLDHAEGIAIFPSVFRAGFAVGGQWGRGIISVRNHKTNVWSAPAFVTIAGGSFGMQIGAQSIDLILVIMDETGLQRLLGNQFKIGGEASVAAGPVGRAAEASTDIQMRAKILSYSRSRGLFAGVAINGSTIAEDKDANQRFYGEPYGSREVIDQASVREDLPGVVARMRKLLNAWIG